MKFFVMENWYKLNIGSRVIMASFGLMIFVICPAYAQSWSKAGAKVTITGNKLTVKYSTDNGIKTKTATLTQQPQKDNPNYWVNTTYAGRCNENTNTFFLVEIEHWMQVMNIYYLDELGGRLWYCEKMLKDK